MAAINDLWEKIGELSEEESSHVLTRLFSSFEERLTADPEDSSALQFFLSLENAVNFCRDCNLNRR